MNEKDFQAEVVRLARLNGFLVYHTHDSRRSQAGFPDLIMLKGDYQIVAELKTDKGKCTDVQADWLEAFDAVRRHRVALWRPKDMEDIIRALSMNVDTKLGLKDLERANRKVSDE